MATTETRLTGTVEIRPTHRIPAETNSGTKVTAKRGGGTIKPTAAHHFAGGSGEFRKGI